MRKLALALVFVLAVSAIPVAAQTTDPFVITITEDRLQQGLDIRTFKRDRYNNAVIDLQPGQAIISVTVNPWFDDSFDATLVATPYIENGRLFWDVSELAVEGEPSERMLTQVRNFMDQSLRQYTKRRLDPGRLIGVQVTETDLILSYERGPR
jgi:hypothetical protein